nr:unnamed protein product [Callosobruchus chinensis]
MQALEKTWIKQSIICVNYFEELLGIPPNSVTFKTTVNLSTVGNLKYQSYSVAVVAKIAELSPRPLANRESIQQSFAQLVNRADGKPPSQPEHIMTTGTAPSFDFAELQPETPPLTAPYPKQ